MTFVKFTYNPKTLRFEKARFNWWNLVFNVAALLFTGSLLFVGLVYLQNQLFESDYEKNLRNENKALSKHKYLVEEEIVQASIAITDLVGQDKVLQKRVLLTEEVAPAEQVVYTKEMLLTNSSAFDELISSLLTKSKYAFQKATSTSYQFSKLYWPVKNDVEELTHYPTLPPLSNFKVDALVCGYGNQINPFNKLLYEHKGIDLAAEKGSGVVASGSGKVILLIRSVMPTGLGNYVIIDHGNGFKTTYAHLQDINVHSGQKILQGQPIGTVGISGGVIAPHLHFEISKNDRSCNPVQFLIMKTDVASFMAMASTNKLTKQALD